MKIQTAIRLNKELYEWIKSYCKKNGLTVTGLITQMIVRFKKNNEKE